MWNANVADSTVRLFADLPPTLLGRLSTVHVQLFGVDADGVGLPAPFECEVGGDVLATANVLLPVGQVGGDKSKLVIDVNPDGAVLAGLGLATPRPIWAARAKLAAEREAVFIATGIDAVLGDAEHQLEQAGDDPQRIRNAVDRLEKLAPMLAPDSQGADAAWAGVLATVSEKHPVAHDVLMAHGQDFIKLALAIREIPKVQALQPGDRVALRHAVEAELSAWRALGLRGPPHPPSREDCRTARGADIYLAPKLARWIAIALELPSTDRAHTLRLRATGLDGPSTYITDGRVSVWVTEVKSQDDVRFEWHASDSQVGTFTAALGTFLAAWAQIAVPKAVVAAGVSEDSDDGRDKLLAMTSVGLCKPLVAPSEFYVPDYPLTVLAPYTSVVGTSAVIGGELAHDKVYDITACRGVCAKTGADSTVLAQGKIQSKPGWGWSVVGTINYDGQPFRPVREYQWVPSTPLPMQPQVYRLSRVAAPLESFSSSLLLGGRSPEGTWFIGGGPTILFGSGSGRLAQWTLDVLWSPAKKLYIGGGVGFRLVNVPIAGTEGMEVFATTTPALPTRTSAEAVLTIGVGFDLSIVGDAATTLFGTKKP